MAKSLIKILFAFVIIGASIGCKQKALIPLENFNSKIAQTDRAVIRFKSEIGYSTKPLYRIIYKASVIQELNDLLMQSVEDSNCSAEAEATITFYKDSTQLGILDFSINPDCPVIYLNDSNKIVKYKMSAYCGMLLQSIKQGEK